MPNRDKDRDKDRALKEVIGAEVRRLRLRKGWSQSDLSVATAGALLPAGVALIEQGRRLPSIPSLCALCIALDVPASCIVTAHAQSVFWMKGSYEEWRKAREEEKGKA